MFWQIMFSIVLIVAGCVLFNFEPLRSMFSVVFLVFGIFQLGSILAKQGWFLGNAVGLGLGLCVTTAVGIFFAGLVFFVCRDRKKKQG